MNSNLLPDNWDAKRNGESVMKSLVEITPSNIKGAHDSDFCIVDGKAYIVYMANKVRAGESAFWPFVYCNLTVVDIASSAVEKTVTFAASEKQYENKKLPAGACFVPRVVQKDSATLRCFFTSEDPDVRQSQVCYMDYDLARQDFDWNVLEAEIQTSQGIFPMQPQYFYRHATAKGFNAKEVAYGLYMIDGIKTFDDSHYAVVNNFAGGQNSLARLNDGMNRFEILGDFFLPLSSKLTESSVNRLPDGSWCAISRQENNDQNYLFSTSFDGSQWSAHESRDIVSDGTSSKPTFDKFGGVYYLGWQQQSDIEGVGRSTFNIDVSVDAKNWQRKCIFKTEKTFQYPTFKQYDGSIYLTVTQGDSSDEHKEKIMFGKLE